MLKSLLPYILILSFSNLIFSQSLSEPCDLQLEIGVSICFDPPGCVVFNANHIGGTEPFTYEWSNGKTTKNNSYFNPNNSYQGTCESVTITDAKGCRAIAGRVYPWQPGPSFGLTPDTIIGNGSLLNFDVSTNDTTSTWNYKLVQSPNHGNITFDITGQGTYTPDGIWCGPDYFRYVAFDDQCNYSEIITANILNGPCANIFTTDIDCNNACTGSALFYQQGIFTPPLTYNWSNGGTEATVEGLCVGNISLTVTDALGVSDVFQNVVEEGIVEVEIMGLDQTCQGTKVNLTPSITQVPAGDLDFSWSGSGVYTSIKFDTTITPSVGYSDTTTTYELILNSSNGCSDTAIHIINMMERPRIIQIKDEKMVCALDTIELLAIIEDGLPPYDYQWIGPMGVQSNEPNFSFPNATANHSGAYKLFLTDLNGCKANKTQNILVPDSLDFQVSTFGSNDLLCIGSDLKLFWGITSGSWITPISIEWTGPNNYFSTEDSPILENIQLDMAGFYTVKVVYGEGCFLMDSTEVFVSNVPAGEVTELEITPPIGCLTNDAQVQMTMSIPPPYSVTNSFDYSTNTFNSNPFTLTNGKIGDYHTIQINTGGCIINQQIDIEKPDMPMVTSTDLTCLGNDGTATVISPNSPKLTARFQLPNTAWNNFVDGLFVDNLETGTYNVYLKDSVTNCQFTQQVTINPYLNFDVTVVDTPSCDAMNGSLEVVSTGQAVAPISFDWNNSFSGNLNTGLEYGWHSVTMTDGDGCERHENIFLPSDEPCNSVITGNAFFNFDCSDCMVDGNEMPFSNLRICAEYDGYTDCFYTNNNGEFWLVPLSEGDYTLTAYPNSNIFQEACIPQTITVTDTATTFSDIDFYFCGDTITDLRVDAYCSVARPGFTQDYTFQVSHEGTSFSDTLIDLTVDLDDNLDVFQITPAPSFQNLVTNQFIWKNYFIEFNTTETFEIKATVNAMLEDTLITTANIISNNIDMDLSNNFAQCEQIVVGSFDPNDKLVNPLGAGDTGNVSEADTMFNYTIRFQNTGTDTAFTVIVRDTLDANVFDLNSVQPRISSHPYQLDVEGDNILVFLFENIELPDSNRNLEASQGFITFDINLKPNLPLGTYIQNSAAIYFDFNEPVITNIASNFLTNQEDIFENPTSLKVFPNPLRNTAFAKINLTESVDQAQLDLFTLDGKLVKSILLNTSLTEGEIIVPFDTNRLPSGIYFIYLKTEKGNVVEKLVKVNH